VKLTRRQILELAAAAAASPVLPRIAGAEAASAAATTTAGRFFTAPELALLDELTEIIVPADEHSGGARAAGVASYIDARLAEFDPAMPELKDAQETWRAGLALMNTLAKEATGKPFLEASNAERVAILEKLAAAEQDPKSDGERFFAELKGWTAKGYYTSRTGLHDELEYKGNSMLPEFVGIDVATLPTITKVGE
jgi:gluconate 2-dehydrogenase gamma chain